MRRVEIAVIGGGPAGAAAAIRLAQAGRQVMLLERSTGPHDKFCGEFLSAEVLQALRLLGLDARAMGAVPVGHVLLTQGDAEAGAPLPFPAASLSRRVLDTALLARAAACGVEVRRGIRVTEVTPAPDGIRLDLGEDAVMAERVIIATGKTDLRGRARETGWPGRAKMLGLKMHLSLGADAAAALRGQTALHLFPGGCAGLQPLAGGANLCITLNADVHAQAGGFDALLGVIGAANHAFAAAMAGAVPHWPRPLAIARVPYGFLRRGAGDPRCYHVGDQAAVTASFTGDGLAIALESGVIAADALARGADAAECQARILRHAGPQVRQAMRLQRLLDRPRLHGPMVGMARAFPGLLRLSAARTRLAS